MNHPLNRNTPARIAELEAANRQLLEAVAAKDQIIAQLSQLIQELLSVQQELTAQAQKLIQAKDKLLRDLANQQTQVEQLQNKYKLLARQVMEM